MTMHSPATFTSDARLFAAIKENFPGVHVRYATDWEAYQLTTDIKHGRPDYADGPSTTEVSKPAYDRAEVIETRKEVFETALQMQAWLSAEKE